MSLDWVPWEEQIKGRKMRGHLGSVESEALWVIHKEMVCSS